MERVVKLQSEGSAKKSEAIWIKWKGEKMMKNHSIRSTVYEVLKMSEMLDVVKINIIGDPSTGKTTLAGTIAHLCHSMSKIPYAVKFLGEKELLDFEATLATLTPTNYVIVFDDVSFLGGTSDRKSIEKVKQAFTKIRHLQGGQDIKIIAIFNIHYSKALDKYLRMCNFRYYTSIGNQETENAIQDVGTRHATKIYKFQKIWQQAYGMRKKFTYQISKKVIFTYKMRQPFAPILYHNGNTLRNIVFPSREWIQPICAACARTEDKEKYMDSNVTIEKVIEDFSKKHTKGVAKRAIELKLIMQGVNACTKRVTHAMKSLDELLQNVPFNLEDMALGFNVKITENAIIPHVKRPNLEKILDDA